MTKSSSVAFPRFNINASTVIILSAYLYKLALFVLQSFNLIKVADDTRQAPHRRIRPRTSGALRQ